MTAATDGVVVAPGEGRHYGRAGAWTLDTADRRRSSPEAAGWSDPREPWTAQCHPIAPC